ncbi:MAG: 16S rRNA (uracil(1498)-N(3))-methyltransferase [Lentisphaerae bacterium GWF2_44_16]|nr:MAG: 16S rRNA (uracil(1498)-N(3))-methyltransferase [Lentisphaerae bacterium GWF2_44_16]
MNLVILFENDFIENGKARIEGRRAKHIISVHRAEKGKELRVGILNGQIGTGIVSSISDKSIEMDVKLFKNSPETLPITLILALPRPKSFRKALQAATSMGVKKIIVIESWKVDKSYWKSPALEKENIFEDMLLGLEQGVDTVMPEITFKRRFKPFVEDELEELSKDSLRLIAEPSSEQPCPFNVNKKTTLVIGPEGGFTPYEVGAFIESGFFSVNIGQRIIRVEYAIPALLGRLF